MEEQPELLNFNPFFVGKKKEALTLLAPLLMNALGPQDCHYSLAFCAQMFGSGKTSFGQNFAAILKLISKEEKHKIIESILEDDKKRAKAEEILNDIENAVYVHVSLESISEERFEKLQKRLCAKLFKALVHALGLPEE